MSDLKMTKNGIEVPVHVNTVFGGRFEATVGDDALHADTWGELEKLVDRATKKVAKSVRVPYTRVTSQRDRNTGRYTLKGTPGEAVGLHSGNGNVLVRSNGQSAQLSGYELRQESIFQPLTGAEVDEYGRLLREREDAQTAVREWENAHKIDLKEAVIKALNEGAATAE